MNRKPETESNTMALQHCRTDIAGAPKWSVASRMFAMFVTRVHQFSIFPSSRAHQTKRWKMIYFVAHEMHCARCLFVPVKHPEVGRLGLIGSI